MNQATNSPPPPGLDVAEILMVVFRHKWKIITISTLGILGAAVLYRSWPIPCKSEARLFIKYVVDTKAPVQGTGSDGRVGMPSERTGENVINTEIEILTSLDLAQQAAGALPADILAKVAGGTNLANAATVIRKNLLAEVSKQSDVLHTTFKHKDPDVVQPVLKQILDTYLTRHAEIHRAIGQYDDYLTKEIDQAKSRLAATEDELRKAKTGAHIISLEDSKKTYGEKLAKLEQDIMDTYAQLAERQTERSEMTRLFPAAAWPGSGSLAASNLSAAAQAASGSNATSATKPAALAQGARVPAPISEEYKRVCVHLDAMNKLEQDLSTYLTSESSRVKGVREQIVAAEKEKKRIEDENPGLLALNTFETKVLLPESDHTSPSSAQISLIAEMARVPALEARLKVLTNQLEVVRREAAGLTDAEGSITDLERRRQTEEAQYNSFEKNLEEIRADEQLGAARNSNIIIIQNPTPPLRDASKLLKGVAGLLFGSIAGAFALAFAVEFYLDPSIKRSNEVERRLRLPLFISIPRLHLNGKADRRALADARTALLSEKTEDSLGQAPEAGALPSGARSTPAVLPWDSRHSLRPYEDALRDRLITYFELKNLTHKPKLVALTSCGGRSGVSTIAAGLAASLSETGEGNVLLVEMSGQNAAHHFYRGTLACGLEDALEPERRGTALVQEKLYVVRENRDGDELPRLLPKNFQHVVSKLKASDYDYIIFDMPPISQISITSRLARFMDIALIVLEAEETDRDLAKRAGAFLAQTGANVGVVLNKTRAYGPRRLQQEF